MDSNRFFSYHNPVHIHFGVGSYAQSLAQNLGSTEAQVGLFYGHSAMQELGAIDAIRQGLAHSCIREYGNIAPNPDMRDISAVLETWPETDWVIGIGGGSVLDFAKSVAFMAGQEESLRTFLTQGDATSARAGLPFIAIPTTSGTGSEVTPWATVWDFEENKKYSLSDPRMFARRAIVDPSLMLGLPPYVTAYSGFDALSHALESFWSRHANPVSDLYAIEAVRLSLAHLGPVMGDLASIQHRAGLARASLYAGMAFSNTKTAAVHAVSYPMTLYYGVPHGVACSLTLAEFWQYNLDAIDPAKVARLLAAVGEKDPEALTGRLRALARQTGLPTTLSQAGIPREGIDVIVDEGFNPARVANNPRQLTRDDLRDVLESIYD
jgi:phosphonate metabolism-associated iron-containing alcohol dehydrogenase